MCIYFPLNICINFKEYFTNIINIIYITESFINSMSNKLRKRTSTKSLSYYLLERKRISRSVHYNAVITWYITIGYKDRCRLIWQWINNSPWEESATINRSEFANRGAIYEVRALSLINQLIRVISLLELVMVCALPAVGLWQSKVQRCYEY